MRAIALSAVLVAGCAPAPMPAPVAESTPAPSSVSGSPSAGARRRPRSCSTLASERALAERADTGAADAGAGDGGVPISNADRVVASLRPQFRDCYNAGLRVDKSMEGCVVMRARVGPDGTVTSNEAYVADGLSADVVACIADALRAATFSPPGGKGSTLMVPVTFMSSSNE